MMSASEKEQLKRDVEAIWNMEDKEVYSLLGLAEMGTKNITQAQKSMSFIMLAAANTNRGEAVAAVSDSLEEDGKNYFEELWEKIKGVICQIYNDKLQIEGKDLAAYLVAAIVSAISISNALAVLVITIAVKRGLDNMCSMQSK